MQRTGDFYDKYGGVLGGWLGKVRRLSVLKGNIKNLGS
jgi:hypothetical protein